MRSAAKSLRAMSSFNPCCSGLAIKATATEEQQEAPGGFNPCCSGLAIKAAFSAKNFQNQSHKAY